MSTREFNLDGVDAKIVHYNARKETMGKALVMACDLKLLVKLSNDRLAMFSPQLLDQIYWNNGNSPAAVAKAKGELDVTVNHVAKPNLRSPQLTGPLPFQWNLAGYDLHISKGVSGQHDIWLYDVKIQDFRITPHEGGQFSLTFRVSKSKLEEKISGWLHGTVGLTFPVATVAPGGDQATLPHVAEVAPTVTPVDPEQDDGDETEQDFEPGTPEHALVNSAPADGADPIDKVTAYTGPKLVKRAPRATKRPRAH